MIPVIVVSTFITLFTLLQIVIVACATFDHESMIGEIIMKIDQERHKGNDPVVYSTWIPVFLAFCLIFPLLVSLWVLSVYWDCYEHLNQQEL
ncbi:hypothetical protein PFISCL1PPCAC_17122 [Pristionchus fissidentatus]|uniref:Transmembrane protein n=1 Tax=Pristionchus fissidentatus TaxID=1538716 RepID=A0AAV5W568_9BILA|nr:hypothetical protein PFISCL1PPCAC_17122 [Pristionchus fissidentatus]